MTDTLQQRRHKQIGALWAGKTRGGDLSYSGEIILADGTKLPIQVWKNAYKNESNKQPDLKIWTPDIEPLPDDSFPTDDPF